MAGIPKTWLLCAIALIVSNGPQDSLQIRPAPDIPGTVGVDGNEALLIQLGLDTTDKIAGLADAGPFIDIEVEERPGVYKHMALANARPGECLIEIGVRPIRVLADREDIEGGIARHEADALGNLDRKAGSRTVTASNAFGDLS